ncbi:MAG: 4-(cytidine 5'-diphospho)-2-C-methyl-D-erythritol kinase [Rhodospirillales bacterium]|nr:4-(cytidine 5'-diphospho)-2-C-methyl-D-erythritol kinase [Rhodospirillales bacterium]
MTSANPVSIAAPAKINLYLHITARRDDGFHLLDSLVAFAGIHDTITINASDDLTFEIDGPYGPELEDAPDNLVLQAARALSRLTGISAGAHLKLVKRLPVASGIGGGSSDAAATLKGLIRLWGVKPEKNVLQALALELGADVPVCLHGRTAFMAGIGEELSAAPALPPCSLVLVNPGVNVSTPEVFKTHAKLGTGFSKPGRFVYAPKDLGELVSILQSRNNDLTPAAVALAPVIGSVLAALEDCNGAQMVRMSGSGATCFALFSGPGEAAAATLKLSHDHPYWWVRAGSLESDINRLS